MQVECVLEPMQELRFVADTSSIEIRLVDGLAECFGRELVKDHINLYKDTSGAIFSYGGCKLHVQNEHKCLIYCATNKMPMRQCCGLDVGLTLLRKRAAATEFRKGPLVMVVGNTDSGSLTVCRILLNYAIRDKWHPFFINLDVGSSGFCPGTIIAAQVTSLLELGNQEIPPFHKAMSLYFGKFVVGDKHTITYLKLCEKLFDLCTKKQKFFVKPTDRAAGCIVHTNTSTVPLCAVLDQLQSFQPRVIVVVGNEQLAQNLKANELFAHSSIVAIDRSTGVLQHSDQRARRESSLLRYFTESTCLYKGYDEVRCFRVLGHAEAPVSALPLGKKAMLDPNRTERMILGDCGNSIVNSVVGVCFDLSSAESSLVPISGLARVTGNDVTQKRIVLQTRTNVPKHSIMTLFFGSIQLLQ